LTISCTSENIPLPSGRGGPPAAAPEKSHEKSKAGNRDLVGQTINKWNFLPQKADKELFP
jgi:hypothetical protein